MARNHVELLAEMKVPRMGGFWGSRFFGSVYSLTSDANTEAAALAVRAGMVYDVNPRPDVNEQPIGALDQLGIDCGRPRYPGESDASLEAAIRDKWNHYQGGLKAAMIEELARAGFEATIQVPGDYDQTPTVVGALAISQGAGSVSAVWPTGHLIGDLGIIFVETANQPVPAIDGWFEPIRNIGVGVPGDIDGCALQVFVRRALTTAEPDVSIPDAGDHASATMIVVRNAAFEIPNVDDNIEPGGGQLVVQPFDATTKAKCLIVWGVANATDGANALSSQANAALSGITEHLDQSHTIGNGGGLAITTGVKATPGAVGVFTASLGATAPWVSLGLTIEPDDYESRFDVTIDPSPVTGPGLSFGAHRVGIDRLGPAGLTAEAYSTIKDIVRRRKPSQWIVRNFRFASSGGGFINLQLGSHVDPAHNYQTA